MSTLEEVIAYLGDAVDAHVGSAAPRTRPDAFVTVERTGGPVSLYSDRASLSVQAWARDREACERLAESVTDALLAMPGAVDDVMRVEAASAYYPETVSGYWPRYVINATVYRGR